MSTLEMVKGPKCMECGEMFKWKVFDEEIYMWIYKCKCGNFAPEVDLIE